MAGEINGTKVLIKKGSTDILGVGEATMTFNGTPISIASKSTNDWETFLDGELAGKGVVIALTVNYNSQAEFRTIRSDIRSGTQDTYTLEYVSDATTDESITGTFVPNGLSDALPMGDKVTSSFTLSSSGQPTFTDAVS